MRCDPRSPSRADSDAGKGSSDRTAELGKKNRQIDIFEQAEPSAVRRLNDLDWPAPDRFPLNIAGRHVRDRVIDDLVESESPLIVTGYAAIDHIVGRSFSGPTGLNPGVDRRRLSPSLVHHVRGTSPF